MQQLTSPSKLPSLRGILRARTHFEVLGFDTESIGVRDISDADVRAAYRRMALRCHPDKCHDLGAQTAFVRVGQAFAQLKSPGGRDEAWRQVVSGHGWLPPTTVPGAEAVRTSTPLEQSAMALRAEGEALVAELRRWKEEWAEGVHAANHRPNTRQNNNGDDDSFFASGAGGRGGRGFGGGFGFDSSSNHGVTGGSKFGRTAGGEGGVANLTRHDPSGVGIGLSAAEIAPMLSGAVFTVREKGRADVKPKPCSLWLGRQKPHVLNYR